ncbi:DUF3800 domain-containing protein [Saccharibacillus endophyticus]|uniref:DUF3800 domain-containing protein n=1 Tax=Saccharibacillus endophyticus TaxID=2060666 RepID=A0ABQ2AC22_9BACL|nr:DUF3800 domain-containing protein [Saccharibacillus endophyticus]GGH88079.1 hypothetical protein GCM10007362_51720 [Saccharibacillus endophyticus]
MLAYIDESGFPHPNDSTQQPVLAAVCIPKDEVRNIMRKMYRIKLDVYGRYDVELKAVNVLKKKSITKNVNNKIFADRVVNEVLSTTLNLKVFAIVMDKPTIPIQLEEVTFPNHYRFLLQRINGYSEMRGKKCVVSFDSQDEGNDMLISNKMKNYLFRSGEGNNCASIVESAFFVSSKVEEGIQLADLCAGIIRKYHEICLDAATPDPFSIWVNELYSKIQVRTCSVPSPNGNQQLHGIYKIPMRLLTRV